MVLRILKLVTKIRFINHFGKRRKSDVDLARFCIRALIQKFDLPGDAEVPATGTFEVLVKALLHFAGHTVDIGQSAAGTVDFGEILRIFGT